MGFRLLNSNDRLLEESHLVIHNNAIVGRVTSVERSAELEKVIGLAYVSPQQSQPGSTFQIKLDNDLEVTAQTVRTPFYDPENLRQAL